MRFIALSMAVAVAATLAATATAATPKPLKPLGWYWTPARAAAASAQRTLFDPITAALIDGGTAPAVTCSGLTADMETADRIQDYAIVKGARRYRYFNCTVRTICFLAPWQVHVYVTGRGPANATADARRIKFVIVGPTPRGAATSC